MISPHNNNKNNFLALPFFLFLTGRKATVLACENRNKHHHVEALFFRDIRNHMVLPLRRKCKLRYVFFLSNLSMLSNKHTTGKY